MYKRQVVGAERQTYFYINAGNLQHRVLLQQWGGDGAVSYTHLLHVHYADFNVGGWPDWPLISENMQNMRYQVRLYGGGLSIGHSWILKKRWILEASIGLGYARILYDKYPCATCGTKLKDTSKNYLGPTKASLSLIYLIK